MLEGVVEAVRSREHERISHKVGEHTVGDPVPQVAEEFVTPFVAVPMPHKLQGSVEVLRLVRREQFFERYCEQMLEVPVPQVAEQFCAQCAERDRRVVMFGSSCAIF